jgi:hypothetical protein
MRGLALLVVAVGVVAAVLAGPAAADTPPSLLFELSSGSSSVYCAATSPRTITPAPSGQGCTITQPAGGTAWCFVKKSTSGPTPITQTCTIKQTSTTRDNFAYVIEIAEHRGGTSPQETTQIATVEQGNTVKTNNSSVTQITKQAFGKLLDSDGDYWGSWAFATNANQIQNATQQARVCQGSVIGDAINCSVGTGMFSHNNSSVIQKQWQSEQAAATASINQEQNTATAPPCTSAGSEPANMCSDVDQMTDPAGSGRSKEGVAQLYVQLQNARGKGATNTTQRQGGGDVFAGVFTGGLEHDIVQVGGGVANITTGQNSFQFQKASNVGSLLQKQDPKIAKDATSMQKGAPGSQWTGNQRAFQFQLEDGALVTSFGGQHTRLEYFGTTIGGTISANQFVNQNGQTQSQSCGPGTSCDLLLDCTNVEPDIDLTTVLALEAQECFTSEDLE